MSVIFAIIVICLVIWRLYYIIKLILTPEFWEGVVIFGGIFFLTAFMSLLWYPAGAFAIAVVFLLSTRLAEVRDTKYRVRPSKGWGIATFVIFFVFAVISNLFGDKIFTSVLISFGVAAMFLMPARVCGAVLINILLLGLVIYRADAGVSNGADNSDIMADSSDVNDVSTAFSSDVGAMNNSGITSDGSWASSDTSITQDISDSSPALVSDSGLGTGEAQGIFATPSFVAATILPNGISVDSAGLPINAISDMNAYNTFTPQHHAILDSTGIQQGDIIQTAPDQVIFTDNMQQNAGIANIDTSTGETTFIGNNGIMDGSITSDGTLIDQNGTVQGKIEKVDGGMTVVKDSSGMPKYLIRDGAIMDAAGNHVGNIV